MGTYPGPLFFSRDFFFQKKKKKKGGGVLDWIKTKPSDRSRQNPNARRRRRRRRRRRYHHRRHHPRVRVRVVVRPRLVPPSFSLPMRQRVAQGLVLVLFSLHSCIKPAHSIAGKCSACKAVATELQDALNKENKQRNHIDMRGRLDSKGQRYGKLIPYSVSEQRYLELVEDFCEKSRVPDYQLSAADASRNETEDSWYKAPRGTVRGAQAKTEQKEIQTYCERVMEEVEEELQTLLYEEKLNETNVEQYVCYELSPQCISKAEWKKNKKKDEGMNRHTGKYDTATMKEL